MQFGTFFTHELPRPWDDDAERRLFENGLAQIELVDQLGFDYAWVAELHFLEEFSHSSAPEIFLAAASQRTSRIRLGHGVTLMPPAYNPTARVVERIATLDLISAGRVDFGFGDSKSRHELEGFRVQAAQRRAMTIEAVGQAADMFTMQPYPGFAGANGSMPARNVVPKPLQRPHPPLWMACSDDASIHLAAQLGVGALTHSFFDGAEARRVVEDYYETFKRECVPIGHSVNPNVAMVNPFYCHPDPATARREGFEAHGFRTFAVRHYYTFGRHRPGRTNLWERFETVQAELGGEVPLYGSHAIGSPTEIAMHLKVIADAGVDQTILVHQAGRTSHEAICDSLRLFAHEVMPGFAADEAQRQARKQAELAPYIEAALARKKCRPELTDAEIPLVDAFGLSRPPFDLSVLPLDTAERFRELQQMHDIAVRLNDPGPVGVDPKGDRPSRFSSP